LRSIRLGAAEAQSSAYEELLKRDWMRDKKINGILARGFHLYRIYYIEDKRPGGPDELELRLEEDEDRARLRNRYGHVGPDGQKNLRVLQPSCDFADYNGGYDGRSPYLFAYFVREPVESQPAA
jgi:hypothetical protein